MKKNNKGFTLAELLIVVAIIAVLTAVAIPIFATQLEKSKEETDIANLRAAKAAAVAAILDETFPDGTVYFDATKGILTTSKPTAYGKGTASDGKCEAFDMGNSTQYTKDPVAKDKVIQVTNSDGTPVMSWVN